MNSAAAIQEVRNSLKGIVMSYASVYFSRSWWMGIMLLVVSFFDLGAGCSGVLAILVCQLCGAFFNFDRSLLINGSYSYNALMTGLAVGSFYNFSLPYLAVLIIAAMLTFFLTVWIAGKMSKAGLPFLSLPFLITIWVLIAGLSNFSGIKLATKATFSLHQWLPGIFERASALVPETRFGDVLHLYLRSLSANLFQYNDLAGIVIGIALLVRSRMAFALSIYGFLIGYAFYYFFEGDLTPFVYSYIGFNFIMTAIALGGFFLVPSTKSHLLLLFAIPVTALLLSALHTLFTSLQLPLYSLPFNIIVLLMLGALHRRQQSTGLQVVTLQQYSPEENHYKSVYYNKRFAGQLYYHLYLPVMGEWHISQGYRGDITHKAEWQHALDFDVRNQSGSTYANTGFSVRDYYCYDLPVLAPAAGYVVTVRDGIQDNAIGEANLLDNWGNTIVIKHAEGLYSKLSHLRAGSIKVKEGGYVMPGEMIASCGSSGRSPEPHLHFQAQAFPYIGAHTLPYPVASYLVKENDGYSYHAFEVPEQGQTVRNVIANPLLYHAFDFTAGRELTWLVTMQGKVEEQRWSVYADIYNRQYIYCHQTGASAFFYKDHTLFYFTDFYGRRSSFLYQFYSSFQKVLLGYYKGVTLEDSLMPHSFFHPLVMSLHDFVAPFTHFLKGTYHFGFGQDTDQDHIVIHTESKGLLVHKPVKQNSSRMVVGRDGILSVEICYANRKTTASCVR